MQTAMEQKRVTSREIVLQYLTRIATYEDKLNAVITVNPKALQEAEERDRERSQGRIRGPLHGIPIALKDNIHTTDMPTTGGALVFDGLVPPYEATLTRNLRDAGAIIIAKTGMTELANWVASGMPGNYNALTGYGMNPYDPRRDPRASNRRWAARAGHRGFKFRHRHRREFLGSQCGYRNLRVHSEPGESEHAGGNQTHRWSREPVRSHPDYGRPGHARTDGPDSDGCRHSAWRSGRRDTRSQRCCNQDLCAASRPRLHALPESRRTQRRAHRHSQGLLLRQDHSARRERTSRRTER